MNKILLKSAMSLAMALIMFESCSTYSKSQNVGVFENQLDSSVVQTVGDSIFSIILNARTVTCELYAKTPTDTLKLDTTMVLPKKVKTVLKYLYFDPANFQSNDIVYGVYNPWVCYMFKATRKRIVYVEMDFGLKKWRLLDADKKEIYMADMRENNMQMLRLARVFFPKSEQLRLLNENLK